MTTDRGEGRHGVLIRMDHFHLRTGGAQGLDGGAQRHQAHGLRRSPERQDQHPLVADGGPVGGTGTTPLVPAGPSAPTVLPIDRTAPRIGITSPRARRYRLGVRLTIRFRATDASGPVTVTATVRRGRAAARRVRQGQHVHVDRTGTYVLRITARDRAGNAASRTVRFRVVRRR